MVLLKRDSLTLKINMLSMFLFSTVEDISYLYVSIEEQEIIKKDSKTQRIDFNPLLPLQLNL